VQMCANQGICFFFVFYFFKAHAKQFAFVQRAFFNKKWNQVFALFHKNRFHFGKKFGFVCVKFYEQFPLKAVFFYDFAQVEAVLLLHRFKIYASFSSSFASSAGASAVAVSSVTVSSEAVSAASVSTSASSVTSSA